MARLHCCLLLIVCCLCPAAAAEVSIAVQSINFESRALPAPFQPRGVLKTVYPQFQRALRSMGEWPVVELGLNMAAMSGNISKEQLARLTGRLEVVYQSIQEDPLFTGIPSALPFCFSEQQVDHGQAFVSFPEHIDAGTRSIIFLHGSGGNFTYYLWQLRRIYPQAILMLPSWEGSWRRGRMSYLTAMLKAVDGMLPPTANMTPPFLMALSDGGMRASEIYAANQICFSGLILLATAPSKDVLTLMPESGHVLAVHGTHDRRFEIANVRQRIQQLARRCQDAQLVEIDGGDHYIMLLEEEPCFENISRFMDRIEAQR